MEGGRRREAESRTRALLLQLLEGACGSREAALSTLRVALVRAELDGVPDTPEEALLFVRAHLLGKLSEDVGARLALSLIDDLTERLEGPSESGVMPLAPPSSAGRVARLSVRSIQQAKGTLLLIDKDALRRATVARLLLPGRWDLRTASSHDEVFDAARDGELPTAIVVAVEHPYVEFIVRTAVANWPGAGVVVHGDLAGISASLLNFLLELRQVRVCTRDESLLDRLDALVAELRRS